MAKIGYARVSTREQNTDHQLDALRAAGCERVFVDKASGKLARRPELDKALEAARARGCRGGRLPALTERQAAQARKMYDEVDAAGNRIHTMTEIAKTFGVSRATLYRHLEPAPAQVAEPATEASPARPPADYVLYGERRPYLVADSLDELTGPTAGVVELPKHLDWSGSPRYNLDTPGRLAELYQAVLAEATRVDDLRTWLNGARLLQLWPQLWLPSKIRRIWEERFPELAAARAAAPAA